MEAEKLIDPKEDRRIKISTKRKNDYKHKKRDDNENHIKKFHRLKDGEVHCSCEYCRKMRKIKRRQEKQRQKELLREELSIK